MGLSEIRASFARQTFMQTLGAELEVVEDGRVVIGFDHGPGLLQQHGFVHAGAVTAVVDSACGYAAMTMMGAGKGVVTVEFKVNFMAPAASGRFVCEGLVVRSGKTISVCEGKVTSRASGKEIARMQATMMTVDLG